MFRCVLMTSLVAILAEVTPALAQDCTGDPIGGFDCNDPNQITAPTGSVFSALGGFSPRRGYFDLLEELGKTEGEEVGGGASADDQGFGVFVNGSAGFVDMSEKRTLGSDNDAYGAVVGADYTTDSFVASVAFDYLGESIDFDNNAGHTDVSEYGVQLLGIAYPIGDLYVMGTTRFAYDDYETRRKISGETGRTTAKGDPEGYEALAAGGVGYDFRLPQGFGVGVLGTLTYQRIHVDSYSEKGAEVVDPSLTNVAPNLRYQSDDINMLTSALELNASKAFNVPWGVLIPEGVFRYLHEFEDDARTINARLIGLEGEGNDAQSVVQYRTDDPDRNYFNVGGAVTSVFPQGWALFVDYHAVVGNSLREEHVVNFGVRTDLDFFQTLGF